MYHRIADDPETGIRPYFRLATSPLRFAEHLDLMAALGLRGVSLEAALRVADTDPAQLSRLVAITFDDGYRDFLEAGWPALERRGFTATVYLPTGCITDQRREFRGFPCLSWDEVRRLRRAGIHFGSHTVTHPVLYRESWDAIREQLVRSKASLETELRETVTSFAYPYAWPRQDGEYTHAFERVLEEAGYTDSVTTTIGRWKPGSGRLALPRLPVNECDDPQFLAAKLRGHYDWLGPAQSLVKGIKARLFSASRRPARANCGGAIGPASLGPSATANQPR